MCFMTTELQFIIGHFNIGLIISLTTASSKPNKMGCFGKKPVPLPVPVNVRLLLQNYSNPSHSSRSASRRRWRCTTRPSCCRWKSTMPSINSTDPRSAMPNSTWSPPSWSLDRSVVNWLIDINWLIDLQYSTGKTTLISYLLGQEYPGSTVGPEPTTDRFTVCVHGDNVREIPGTSLVQVHGLGELYHSILCFQDTSFPFQSLQSFGGQFLEKLACASMPSELLKHISFVDTPGESINIWIINQLIDSGVLSGNKQRDNRGYAFEEIVRFLADKVWLTN